MAKGDVKSVSYGGGGGWGSTYTYDDEGRGQSKTYWEQFKAYFYAVPDNQKQSWLVNDCPGRISSEGLGDDSLVRYIENMTHRYNIHDWAWQKFEDSANNDGRVRRAVVDACGLEIWRQLQKRAARVLEERKEQRRKEHAERSAEWENERLAIEAERIKRKQELVADVKKQVNLIAGNIRSDFEDAYAMQERYGRDGGDWLDDPVAGVASGYGFGEEVKQPHGIKLQVTVSLDCSNSMMYNNLAESAATAFRDIYLALYQLQQTQQYGADLFIAPFTFAKDGYAEGVGTDNKEWRPGREARLVGADWRGVPKDFSEDWKSGKSLAAMDDMFTTYHRSIFSGEDTWFYPLFEKIEAWENEYSDPQAVRLDIIITDAVIEHPRDITESDKIQERRNGNLQTVLLNLLPEHEWVNSDLPLRCVQYAANKDNIGGLLRQVLSQFLAVNM